MTDIGGTSSIRMLKKSASAKKVEAQAQVEIKRVRSRSTSTSAYLTAAALLDGLFEHPDPMLTSTPLCKF